MMVIFHPGPRVSWCGEAFGPPAVPDEAWWEITQSSLLSDSNSLFGCNKQANPCMCVHTHTRRHLWLCALIALCEITAVTTAVWATPRFPGHLGHQLPPRKAPALSLSDPTTRNESSPCCWNTTETLPSIHASLPYFSLSFHSSDVLFFLQSHFVDVCVCVFIDRPRRDNTTVCAYVEEGVGCPQHCGVSPRQQRCHQQMEFLEEPRKENPAEVLFDSAWNQRGAVGSVWSTSASQMLGGQSLSV